MGLAMNHIRAEREQMAAERAASEAQVPLDFKETHRRIVSCLLYTSRCV